MSNPTSRRRGAPRGNSNSLHHGAPRGNRNALKHGIYSHSFTRREKDLLDRDIEGELNDEEKLLNILIDRAVVSMRREKLPHDQFISTMRLILLAIGRKAHLQASRKAIYDQLTTLEQAMGELKYLPPEVD